MELRQFDVVLCEFYVSDLNKSKKRPILIFKDNLPYDDFVAIPISSKIDNVDFQEGSISTKSKLMIRKTFVVSKNVVLKKYGILKTESFLKYQKSFCKYFGCQDE